MRQARCISIFPFLVTLQFCFISLIAQRKDIQGHILSGIVTNEVWASKYNLVDIPKNINKITLTLTSDSAKHINEYQLKFRYDNTFQISGISSANAFGVDGNEIPAGTKFENTIYQYFIKGSKIKFVRMVTYAKNMKTKVVGHYYKVKLTADTNTLEFIPIRKWRY